MYMEHNLFIDNNTVVFLWTWFSSLKNLFTRQVSKLNKILAQVVQLEEDEGAVENDF